MKDENKVLSNIFWTSTCLFGVCGWEHQSQTHVSCQSIIDVAHHAPNISEVDGEMVMQALMDMLLTKFFGSH